MWQDRIAFESLTSRRPSAFVTLTYQDKYLPSDRSVHLAHVQNFNKRLRYYLSRSRNYDDPKEHIRFFCSSEYGEETYRPHYHLCITNLDAYDARDFDCLYKAWSYGRRNFDPIGILTADGLLSARIRYCVEYISHESPVEDRMYEAIGLKPLFHCMSKSIGADWIAAHKEELLASQGYWQNGKLRPLPYYYKKKLGMVKEYEYLNTLDDMWSGYNAKLKLHGFDPINPFDVDGVCQTGLLDQVSPETSLNTPTSYSPESRRTFLSYYIGNPQRAIDLAKKTWTKSQKRKNA